MGTGEILMLVTAVLDLFGWNQISVAGHAWRPMPSNNYLDINDTTKRDKIELEDGGRVQECHTISIMFEGYY